MDISRIESLLATVHAEGIDELHLKEAGFAIQIHRRADGTPVTPAAGPTLPETTAAAVPATPAAMGAAAAGAQPPHGRPAHVVEAPMMGIFYRAASPGAAPLAAEGTAVAPDTVLCIVEAMKIMNQIEAGATGTVLRVLAQEGAMVQAGQPLFEIA